MKVYDRLKGYIKKKDALDAYLLLSEAIIDKIVFEMYELSEESIEDIIKSEGVPAGWLPLMDESAELPSLKSLLKKEYLEEFELNEDDLQEIESEINKYIKTLRKVNNDINIKIIQKSYDEKDNFEYDNAIERASLENEINPISFYNKMKPADYKIKELVFLEVDNAVKEVLKESEYGFLSVETSKHEIKSLGVRTYFKLEKLGYDDRQFHELMEKSLEEYLKEDYGKIHSRYYKNTPVIWQLGNKSLGEVIFLHYHRLNKNMGELISRIYIKEKIASYELKEVKGKKDETALKNLYDFNERLLKAFDEMNEIEIDDGVEKNSEMLKKYKVINNLK